MSNSQLCREQLQQQQQVEAEPNTTGGGGASKMATRGYGLQSDVLSCREYPATACQEVYKIEDER